MHYIDLHAKKLFKDCGKVRVLIGTFDNAKDLQTLLNDEIAMFTGYKNPKSFISVIKKFEKDTNEHCIY